jgi:transcription antitermination factor NusG
MQTKKTVKISENDLVNLIDGIVTEAVGTKKKEWLAEQAKKGNKTAILESRLASLEAKIKNLSKTK